MKSRVLVTVLAMAGAALALLSLRQQRIAVVHDMSRLHMQLDQQRMHLWRLRAHVATAVRPGAIRPDHDDHWAPAVPIEPDEHEDTTADATE